MAITYKSGRRIQATAADFGTNGAGVSAVAGGWVELGRTTLGSAVDTIDVTSLPDKRYYMVLQNPLSTGIVSLYNRLNSDSAGNYARRRSEDGATDATNTSNSVMNYYGDDVSGGQHFAVSYLSNLSSKEKLSIGHSVLQNTSGAGTAPRRFETVGKWTNTSDSISSIQAINLSGGSFNTGSEVVVLGWDDSDTHSTNFWEELSSTDLSGGAAASLSSGTIAAKKYLWVQFFGESSGGNIQTAYQFNSDTGSNYAYRTSTNGGADWAGSTRTQIGDFANSPNNDFTNMFIVNNSANEKLAIGHIVFGQTAGAGTVPNRVEYVGKWANTSSQITEINAIDVAGAGQFGTNTIMKVWGHD